MKEGGDDLAAGLEWESTPLFRDLVALHLASVSELERVQDAPGERPLLQSALISVSARRLAIRNGFNLSLPPALFTPTPARLREPLDRFFFRPTWREVFIPEHENFPTLEIHCTYNPLPSVSL